MIIEFLKRMRLGSASRKRARRGSSVETGEFSGKTRSDLNEEQERPDRARADAQASVLEAE